jgi:hypothetical protein
MVEKVSKGKPKRAKSDKKRREAAAAERFLRLRTDPRAERRYSPRPSLVARGSIVAAWVGAALVGAGIYGQWLRPEAVGPHKAASYLLAAGAVVLLAVALFGQRDPAAVRVGDAGIGVEKDAGHIERIAWCDVTQMVVSRDALTVQAAGRQLSISLAAQPQAAARAIAEARKRIPKRIEELDDASLEPAEADAGVEQRLEPPQVAGQRCKATDKLITFERDARLCGRCGELYHKDSVPRVCETCNAPLT